MKGKTIAFVGVDGSGKSTLIKNLQQLLKDKCIVQYMGCRSYEDPKLVKLLEKNNLTKIEKLYLRWLQYRCFRKRYDNAVATGKIVLFDRFVDELYINASKYNFFYVFLYKYVFPRPSCLFYLHCSVDESLHRKNDVPDSVFFRTMKVKFDNRFLKDPKCICLNSEEFTPQELTTLVYNHIIEYYNHE